MAAAPSTASATISMPSNKPGSARNPPRNKALSSAKHTRIKSVLRRRHGAAHHEAGAPGAADRKTATEQLEPLAHAGKPVTAVPAFGSRTARDWVIAAATVAFTYAAVGNAVATRGRHVAGR